MLINQTFLTLLPQDLTKFWARYPLKNMKSKTLLASIESIIAT